MISSTDPVGASQGPTLPAAVRDRLADLTGSALRAVPPQSVPGTVGKFRNFKPDRLRLVRGQLAAAVDAHPEFRKAVAEVLVERHPDLAASIMAGSGPGASDPRDVAALAYLLRPDGWPDLVAAAVAELTKSLGTAAVETADSGSVRQSRQAEEARRSRERQRHRREIEEVRAERDGARRGEGEARGQADELRRTLADRERDLATLRAELQRIRSDTAAEARRLRSRISELEALAASARRSDRDRRQAADIRLRVLLETLAGVLAGLRQELAVPAGHLRPADLIAETAWSPAASTRSGQADGPGQLETLLAAPGAHLLVDGYNVTMTGYGDRALADQRTRLNTGLGALSARTGAEVTCVFDGAARPAVQPSVRGVRVLFSEPDKSADELIRRLVAAEPAGRTVVVVSSDREVAAAVGNRPGGYAVASATLLRVLERGTIL